jgi:predicted DNA-binding ribbon-helix-helix protein
MITADNHVEELLEKYPGINRYLMRRGIICVQCGETFWGTLGELIREKNMNVDEIIAELNSEFAE